MKAYITIGNKNDVFLDEVTALEKKYKSHRRVFDGVTNQIMMVAEMPRTAHQIKIAVRTAKARDQKEERAALLKLAEAEITSRFCRRDRANRTDEQRENDNESAKCRKNVLLTKQYVYTYRKRKQCCIGIPMRNKADPTATIGASGGMRWVCAGPGPWSEAPGPCCCSQKAGPAWPAAV